MHSQFRVGLGICDKDLDFADVVHGELSSFRRGSDFGQRDSDVGAAVKPRSVVSVG